MPPPSPEKRRLCLTFAMQARQKGEERKGEKEGEEDQNVNDVALIHISQQQISYILCGTLLNWSKNKNLMPWKGHNFISFA